VPYREALLLRTLVHHPWLLEDYAETIADVTLASEPMRQLRDAILQIQANHNSLDRLSLTSQLGKVGLERLLDLLDRAITHKCDRFAEVDAQNAEVEAGWRHALALHERQLGLKRALDAAERSWHDNGSEEALARIVDIQRQLNALETAERDDFGDSSGGR
jgi:DNA primase